MEWIDNLPLFKRELEEGFKWQVYVAKYLAEHGYKVDVPALKIRKSISEIPNFTDYPDLLWGDRIFEVKSRKLYFTCPKDFPYRDILVDTVSGWRDKKRKPDGYICISTQTREMICLSSKTSSLWKTTRKWDHTRKIEDLFYAADKNLWIPIEKMIKEMSLL